MRRSGKAIFFLYPKVFFFVSRCFKKKIVMQNIVKAGAGAAGTLLLMDGIYLNVLPFRAVMEKVQQRPLKPKWGSVVLCYVLLITAVTYFGTRLTVSQMALLGATVYGVYELTNHATLDKWPIWMVVVDTLWGAALFAAGGAVVKALSLHKQHTKTGAV